MKKFIAILLIVSFGFPLFSAETESTEAEKPAAQESEKSEMPPASEKKEKPAEKAGKKEKNDEKPRQEGPILRNYDMLAPYEEITREKPPLEHYSINIFYGLVSGALIGTGMGLYAYQTDTTTNQISDAALSQLLLFSGIGAGAGIIAGVTLSIIESNLKQPLVLGMPIFEKVWYGTVMGGIAGALIGLIPYGTANNTGAPGETDVILQYTGYGVMGGFVLGVVLNFVLPADTKLSYNLVATPELTQVSLTVPF